MGKVIKKKIQGMSWWAKFSLVALLTLATTVFMYEGWYKPKSAEAAVSHRASTTGSSAAATVVINVPAGTVAGDVMIANISATTATVAATSAGWTQMTFSDYASGTARRMTTLYRIATASEPASYTFAATSATVMLGSISTFTGTDTTSPISVIGTPSVQASATGVAATALTTLTANSGIVFLSGVGATSSYTNTAWSTTGTGTMTELVDASPVALTVGAAFGTQATVGTTGAGTATLGTAGRNIGVLIALKPLSGTTPTVTSTSPSSLGIGATNQNVVITGSNFVSGASLAASFGTGVTVNSTTFNSATQITANVTVTGTAGAKTVSVTNGDGGGPGTLASGFTVNAAPTVTSAAPNAVGDGAQNVDVVITGTGFSAGAPLAAVFSGTGITVNSTTFNSATQITANVTLSGAAAGARTITVTDGDYGVSTAASVFTVNAAPTVTSASPNSLLQGATSQVVQITGTGFQAGTPLAAVFSGTGITVNSTTFSSATRVDANITIAAGATTGLRDVTVIDGDYGRATGTGIFTVNTACAAATPTALTVGSVTASSVPLTWTAGANDDSYIIYRDGLQKASGVIGTSYTDNTAAAGTTYSYTVSGYNNAGTCGSSQTSPATANTISNVPAAPTVSNSGTGTSLTVAVNGNGNGAATTYAIRINGGAYTNQFVQAGGTIGGTQAWQTAAAWGTTTIAGLTTGTNYTFDVIARNGALVVTSYGPTASKAPVVSLSATITTCAGCHGNPPVDNAARVGGTTGQFQGSHNTHSGTGANQYGFACTKCHTDNGTNLAHADGNINIALTPGTYTKGSSFAPNNTTFSGGNCNATYCHSNATGGTSNAGETRAVVSVASPAWGGVATCTTCHAKPPAYTNYTGSVATAGSKANAHLGTTHASKTCDTCHDSVATSDGGATYTTTTAHADGTYTIKATLGYTYNARRGGTCATPGCHGSVNWGGKLGCVDCHSQSYTRTKGAIGATLAAVTAEFGLAYGHKKTGRGAVTDADCIVCHLEGDSTTKKTSATYHQNGTIDLRDPDGTGEARITDIGGASWSFTRFSTSFAAGTRTSTGHTSNTIANIITQKFCLKCHDSNGANNPAARVTGGTAWMPWGGSTGYTAQTAANLNGVPVANGLVNVFSQFSTGNSSLHPVRGPRTKDFPTQARMVAPYNGFTRTGTAGATAAGIVINCFDCHNNYPTLNYLGKTGLLTLRTNAAHGTSGAAASGGMMRGTFYVAAPTLCGNCHSGYTVTGQHGAGSAMASNTGRTDEGFNGQCSNCHGSKTSAPATAPARPIPAADYHGSNNRLTGTLWPTINARPVAFIRGWSGTAYHRGRALAGTSGYAAGTAQCGGGTCPNGGNVGDGSNRNYTPGGTY